MNNFFANKAWLASAPKSIRQWAVEEAVAARKAACSNMQAGNIKHFDMQFRSKKKEEQNGLCLGCERSNVKTIESKLFIFEKLLGEMRYFSTKQKNKLLKGRHPTTDCKIQKDKYGDYYLIMTIAHPIHPPRPCQTIVSVDPGIRRFATLYSPNTDSAHTTGNNYDDTIMPLLVQLDKLISMRCKSARPLQVDKKIRRLRKRVVNLKLEMRNKIANWMAKEFDVILMPKLDVQGLSITKNRRLKTKTVRQMMSMGHGDFFRHLGDKCCEFGSKLLRVSEHFTTKTCVKCGTLNDIGSNKVYTCAHCMFEHDRDLVGSCGIFLRALRSV
jgi:putative transposase